MCAKVCRRSTFALTLIAIFRGRFHNVRFLVQQFAFAVKGEAEIRIETCRLVTQGGSAHRTSDGSPIWALVGLAGALSTAAHAGGKSLSLKPFADPELSGILSRRIQSANQ